MKALLRKSFLLILVIIVLIPATSVMAQEAERTTVPIYLGSKQVQFDVLPIIDDGTTLVQLRPFFEGMGLALDWNPQDQTITGKKGKLRISLQIGSLKAERNGQLLGLEKAPKIIEGSTMVPLRFVAEAMGYWVYFDGGLGGPKIHIERSLAVETFDRLYSEDVKYEGETLNGSPNGKGKYVYQDKLWYEGDFVNGRMEGKGKLYQKDKMVYEGDMRNDLPNGTGHLLTAGDYQGGMKNGMRHGKGLLSLGGKLQYDGDFYEDSLTGEGTIYDHAHEEKYVGGVFMGIRQGQGKVYDKDGDLYYDGPYYGNHPTMDSDAQTFIAAQQYAKAGKDAKADKKFEQLFQSITDNDQKYEMYFIIGQFFLNIHKPQKAIDYLERGIGTKPDKEAGYYYGILALAYHELGDEKKVQEYKDKAKAGGFEEIDKLLIIYDETKQK